MCVFIVLTLTKSSDAISLFVLFSNISLTIFCSCGVSFWRRFLVFFFFFLPKKNKILPNRETAKRAIMVRSHLDDLGLLKLANSLSVVISAWYCCVNSALG